MIPLIVGTLLALGALTFVLYPLLFSNESTSQSKPTQAVAAPVSVRESAVDALREIEFDRATGKLSDSDYAALKSSYTQRAVNAMRAGETLICEKCGPRPEIDATFCSRCGAPLTGSR